MLNLFSRSIDPKTLSALTYTELKFWNDYHKLLIDAERKQAS